MKLTRLTRTLLPEIFLSVTVPHILSLNQQEQLAIDLTAAGANLIQTEGGTSARPISPGNLGLVEKAAPTLAASYSISTALKAAKVDIPVICASGLSSATVAMAIALPLTSIGTF